MLLGMRIYSRWVLPSVGTANAHGQGQSRLLLLRLGGAAKKLQPRRTRVKALNPEKDGGASGFAGRNWDPGLEIEVPFEQRPVNEYSSLKDGPLCSWGELGPGPFFTRLGGLWLVAFTVLGAPVAAASFDPYRERNDISRREDIVVSCIFFMRQYDLSESKEVLNCMETPMFMNYADHAILQNLKSCSQVMQEMKNEKLEPLRFILAAGTGTLFLVSLVVLRIYLGWSYVGDRLLSAVIPYEESGWYDGQMWVKPPEVKPVIKLLKQTLVSTGVLLVSAILLFIFATPVEDFLSATFASSDVPTSKIKSSIRREDLLRLPVEVMDDDELAAAAAEAADGRPVYCRDRYYHALAGGQYCKWSDLLK
ncbi:hypothetical protein ACLOJK_035923 [Asimina triloba]